MDKENPTVLVTGASGFIGGHLVEELLKKGVYVRAQYKPRNLPAHLLRAKNIYPSLELFSADLTDFSSARRLLRDIDYVVHVAGLASDWGPFKRFYRINFLATWNLVREAFRHSVKKFILISSIAVHGFGRHVDTTEEGPYYPLVSPYQITKKMAEDFSVAFARRYNFPLVVIRPGNVYGPRDTTTFYRLFEAMEKGMNGYIGGGKTLTCPTYVSNLVDAILLSLEREDLLPGEVFNITDGDKVTWREIMEYSSHLLGIPRPKLSLPVPVAYFVANSLEKIYKFKPLSPLLKGDPPLTFYRVSQLAHHYHFSIEKAKRILGYSPKIHWRDGFAETVRAYFEYKRANAEKEKDGSC